MTDPASKPQPEIAKLGDLKACFIVRCDYRLNPTWVMPSSGESPMQISVKTTVVRAPAAAPGASARERQVTVAVSFNNGEANPLHAYVVKTVEAVAVVSGFEAEWPDDKVDQHAARIGVPVAYSCIREFLLDMSARGPYPKLLLPLVPLADLVQNAQMPNTASGALTDSATR